MLVSSPMPPEEKSDVLIPEVLPPDPTGQGFRPPRSKARRAERAFGPIVAGAIIDAIDFVTWGFAGLIIGGLAAFWICSIYRLPWWQRLLWSLGAAYYCAVPFTRFLPLGMLIGAYVQFRESKD